MRVIRCLWWKSATPFLPLLARPFAGILEMLIVNGIEAIYQLIMTRQTT